MQNKEDSSDDEDTVHDNITNSLIVHFINCCTLFYIRFGSSTCQSVFQPHRFT